MPCGSTQPFSSHRLRRRTQPLPCLLFHLQQAQSSEMLPSGFVISPSQAVFPWGNTFLFQPAATKGNHRFQSLTPLNIPTFTRMSQAMVSPETGRSELL